VTKAKSIGRQASAIEPEADLILPESWKRRPWIPYLIVVAVIAAVIGAGLAMDKALQPAVPSQLANCKTSTEVGPRAFLARQPICIIPGKKYTATLDTTAGQIVIDLIPEYAPVTVNNFVVLAVNGYYNGLQFWDAPDWEVQGGDPLANGRGGPGYDLPEEPSPLIWGPGSVGMARIPGGPINGSQFFIVKSTWPNGAPAQIYNRFGTVVSGLDKVSAIAAGDRINTITIRISAIKVSGSR
jgi:cyclophilin family peptidyl-prolyl cis-trans isomerase